MADYPFSAAQEEAPTLSGVRPLQKVQERLMEIAQKQQEIEDRQRETDNRQKEIEHQSKQNEIELLEMFRRDWLPISFYQIVLKGQAVEALRSGDIERTTEIMRAVDEDEAVLRKVFAMVVCVVLFL